jgi:sialic acid synthase SpsE
MEKTKIIVNINWEYDNGPNSLIILRNIIEALSAAGVEYIKLDIGKCLGFNTKVCDEFDDICREHNIFWIPIITSINSLNFTRPYHIRLFNGKSGYAIIIPSTHNRDLALLEAAQDCADYIILHTGLCNQSQVDRAIELTKPDIVFHEAYGEGQLDYLLYLQHISSEFYKNYEVGFTNFSGNSYALIMAASILGAKYVQYSIVVNETSAEYYLATPSEFNQLFDLANDLSELGESRGGYGIKKLNKIEKAYLKS